MTVTVYQLLSEYTKQFKQNTDVSEKKAARNIYTSLALFLYPLSL